MDIVGIKRFLNKNKDKTLDEIISESVVNGIGNVIGNSGSPAGPDTLFGLLKRGVVKSIQRGTATYGSDSIYSVDPSKETLDINISSVNPSKVFVLLKEEAFGDNGGDKGGHFYTSALLRVSSNTITVRPAFFHGFNDGYYGEKFSWQVIEFY